MALNSNVEKIWNGLAKEAKDLIREGDFDSLLTNSPQNAPLNKLVYQQLSDLIVPKGDLSAVEVFVKEALLMSLYLSRANGLDSKEAAKDYVDLYRMMLPEESRKVDDRVITATVQPILETLDHRIVPATPRFPLISRMAIVTAIDNNDVQKGKSLAEHFVFFLDYLSNAAPFSQSPKAAENAAALSRMFSRAFTANKIAIDPIEKIRKTYGAKYGIDTSKMTANSAGASKIDEAGLAAALAKLDALEGLGKAKESIYEQVALVRQNMERQAAGLKTEPMTHHMMFAGNPGTGKTTLARIYGDIAKALGLVEKGTFTEVSAADLIAGYVGQTAPKTREVCEKAKGGVLFIDEAYSLVSSSPNEKGSSFAQDALGELVAQMENNRANLIVIFAGYPKEMTQLLKANPGMPSRIGTQVDFEDYTPKQLMKIFGTMLAGKEYTASPEVVKEVERIISEQHSKRGAEFGNARMVRDLVEGGIKKQAYRLSKNRQDGLKYTRDELMELKVEDLAGVDLNKSIKYAANDKAGGSYSGKSKIGFVGDTSPRAIFSHEIAEGSSGKPSAAYNDNGGATEKRGNSPPLSAAFIDGVKVSSRSINLKAGRPASSHRPRALRAVVNG